MDDDGWNRSLYVAWTVKTWQISDFKLQRITMYSPIRITRDLFCGIIFVTAFPVKRNCDELELIACDVKWTVTLRPWVSYLSSSPSWFRLRKSLISLSLFSRYKKPILFFCLDVASFVREVDESFSESQQMQMSHQWSELTLGQNLGSEIKSEINEIRKCIGDFDNFLVENPHFFQSTF